jgi:hypothetical protein
MTDRIPMSGQEEVEGPASYCEKDKTDTDIEWVEEELAEHKDNFEEHHQRHEDN